MAGSLIEEDTLLDAQTRDMQAQTQSILGDFSTNMARILAPPPVPAPASVPDTFGQNPTKPDTLAAGGTEPAPSTSGLVPSLTGLLKGTPFEQFLPKPAVPQGASSSTSQGAASTSSSTMSTSESTPQQNVSQGAPSSQISSSAGTSTRAPSGAALASPSAMPGGASQPAPAPLGPIKEGDPQGFFETAGPYARQVERETGVPAALSLAIAANETGYGQTRYMAGANNYHGIQAQPGEPGAVPYKDWRPGAGGQQQFYDAAQRSFASPLDGFRGFANFLTQNPRYAPALQRYQQTHDVEQLAADVKEAGYAEDPAYVRKITAIMRGIPVSTGVGEVTDTRGVPLTGATTPSGQPAAPRGPYSGAYTQQGLADAGDPDAWSKCGPVAAFQAAKVLGRDPTPAEVERLAKQYGWTGERGMAGLQSEANLLNGMNIAAKAEEGPVDWRRVIADLQRGNPVLLQLPGHEGHYITAQKYDPQTGKIDFGSTVGDLRAAGHKTQFTPQELEGLGWGSPNGALWIDNPATPAPSVVAGQSASESTAVSSPTSPSALPTSPTTSTSMAPSASTSDQMMYRQPLQPTPGDAYPTDASVSPPDASTPSAPPWEQQSPPPAVPGAGAFQDDYTQNGQVSPWTQTASTTSSSPTDVAPGALSTSGYPRSEQIPNEDATSYPRPEYVPPASPMVLQNNDSGSNVSPDSSNPNTYGVGAPPSPYDAGQQASMEPSPNRFVDTGEPITPSIVGSVTAPIARGIEQSMTPGNSLLDLPSQTISGRNADEVSQATDAPYLPPGVTNAINAARRAGFEIMTGAMAGNIASELWRAAGLPVANIAGFEINPGQFLVPGKLGLGGGHVPGMGVTSAAERAAINEVDPLTQVAQRGLTEYGTGAAGMIERGAEAAIGAGRGLLSRGAEAVGSRLAGNAERAGQGAEREMAAALPGEGSTIERGGAPMEKPPIWQLPPDAAKARLAEEGVIRTPDVPPQVHTEINSLDELQQTLAHYRDQGIPVYERATTDIQADTRRGYSTNHQTGQREAGLSVNEVDPETTRQRLGEIVGSNDVYGAQMRGVGDVRRYLVTGEEVGRGADNEPLLSGKSIRPLATLNPGVLDEAGLYADLKYLQRYPNDPWYAHRNLVSDALARGETVPPEVLAEWPALAKKYPEAFAALEKPPNPPPPRSTANALPGEPETSRFYHGTASSFERANADKFDPNGLYGPGYYLTSDPRVAGSYAEQRGTRLDSLGRPVSPEALGQRIEDNNRVIEELQARAADRSLSRGSRNAAQRQIVLLEEENRGLTTGPNVRPLDVPNDLKFLDVDQPLRSVPDFLDSLEQSLGDPRVVNRFRDAMRDQATRARGPMTVDDAWRALETTYRDIYRTDNPYPYLHKDLADAGYDGIQHAGGQRVPLMDETGRPIEHDVRVIFPESLGKIRQAYSGDYGGALPSAPSAGRATNAALLAAPGRAVAGGATGAVTGGVAGYESSPEGASPEETVARTIAGAGAGALAGTTIAGAGTLAAGRLVDSLVERGALNPRVLASHPKTAERIRALFSVAADGLPDDAPVPVPAMVQAMVRMRPDIAGKVSDLLGAPVTAGQVRQIVGAADSPGVAQTVQELVVDALTGLGARGRRGRELAADAATVRGLASEAAQATRGRAASTAPTLDGPTGPARRVDPSTSPNLTSFVDEIADKLGVASPGVYLSDTPVVNAAATTDGKSPALIITRGLLKSGLTDDEMAAVLTHELAHTAQDSRGPVGRAFGAVREAVGSAFGSGELANATPDGVQPIVLRPPGWEAGSDAVGELTRPGHFYRGMTEDEFNATLGGGQGVQSRADYSVVGEGTSFSHSAADAESYANYGRDDPRKTGRPTYLVEIRGDQGLTLDRDGYWKAQGEIPADRISRIIKMEPGGGAVLGRDLPVPLGSGEREMQGALPQDRQLGFESEQARLRAENARETAQPSAAQPRLIPNDPLQQGMTGIAPAGAALLPPSAQRAVQQAKAQQQPGLSPLQWTGKLLGEVGYSSMIGPATFSVNMLGNLMEPLWSIPKEATRAIVRGNPREFVKMAGGAFHGMGQLGTAMVDALASRGRFAATPGHEPLSAVTTNPIGKAITTMLEGGGRVFSALPDAIFGTIATGAGEARTAAQIATDAGLKGQAWKQHVSALLADVDQVKAGQLPSIAGTQDVIDGGAAYAKRQTFQDELGTIGKKARTVATLGDLPVVGHLITPFFNTPWNMNTRMLERTPAGFAMNSQGSRFDKLYDATLGSALLIGLAAGPVASGTITGGGPDDPQKKAEMRSQGWRPYSTLVDGVYVPNRVFGIYAPLLNAAADVHDSIAYAKDKSPASIASNYAGRLGAQIQQQPYLQGISNIMQAIQAGQGGGLGSAAEQFASSTLTRMVPYAATGRAVGTALDPNERTVERGKNVPAETTIGQQVQQGVGLRGDLPIAQDVLGRPQANPQQGWGALFAKTSPEKADPIIKAFLDNQVDIGSPRQDLTISLYGPDGKVSQSIPMPLTPAEQRTWNQLRGDALINLVGPATKDPEFAKAPPDVQAKWLQTQLQTANDYATRTIRGQLPDPEITKRIEPLKKAS
jgi:flagellum-specific peptidoglycan hydrolase FlgJ